MSTISAVDRSAVEKTVEARFALAFLRRSFTSIATSLQLLIDAGAVFLACAAAYVVWSRVQPLPQVVAFSEYVLLFAVITVIEVGLFFWLGMYRTQKSILNIEDFRGTLKAVAFGFLVVTCLHFTLEESVIYPRTGQSESGIYRIVADAHHAIAFLPVRTYSRYVVGLAFAFIFVFVAVERWICFKAIQYLHLRGFGTSNLLILGAGSLGRMLQKRLFLSPRLGYNLVGFLDSDPSRVGHRVMKSRVLGTLDDLERIIKSFKVGMVLLANPNVTDAERQALAERCHAAESEIAFVPPLVVAPNLPPLRVSRIESFPLLTFAKRRTRPLYNTYKRAFDLTLAGLAIAIFLPFFLFLPFLIKLTSPGPALFRQTRIGKDGKPFEMLKFRTMHVDAPKYSVSPKTHDDPRLTRLGRFLRRTSIDELPQLLNVLKGEMSIVGPRPEMPFIVERYDAVVRQRLHVKPGMTGLWQISHAREEDIHENVDYDLYYVENASITMDVAIVILTAFSVIRGVGAY